MKLTASAEAAWPDDWRIWHPVSKLAELENTSRQQIYHLIDSGMPHSRHGDRIRVRRGDFHEWHLRHMVNPTGAAAAKAQP